MTNLLFVSTFLVISALLVDSKKLEGWSDPEIHGSVEPNALRSAARNPKLFWGTTTTSTATLSTTTACFVSNAALSAACAKKKRAISDLPFGDHASPDMILPSSPRESTFDDGPSRSEPVTQNQSKASDLNQLTQLQKAQEELEPRFFLFYWYTSTVTTTTTTFTKTTTFTLAVCSPASFAYTLCG